MIRLDSSFKQKLEIIIREGDLNVLTAKSIRCLLETQLHLPAKALDKDPLKTVVNKAIEEIFLQYEAEHSHDSEKEDPISIRKSREKTKQKTTSDGNRRTLMSSTVEAEKSSDQGNSRTKREIHSSEDKDLEDDISPSKRKNLGKRRLEEESEEEDIAPVRKRESKKKTPQHIEESEEEDIAPVRKRESKKKTPQHIEESEEEPSVPKRKRVEKKTLRKESTSKPTEKKHRTSEIVHDSDEESNTSDSGSPPTKLKHKSTPKIVQEEEEDEANELKSPAPKKTEAKRTSAKENASRASPNEEKIKRLKHYINKCGVRKQWGKELADCKTAKSQTNKLEAILKELGVTGRPTLEKCEKVKMEREFRDELASLDSQNILDHGQRVHTRAKQVRRSRAILKEDSEEDNGEDSEEDNGKDKF